MPLIIDRILKIVYGLKLQNNVKKYYKLASRPGFPTGILSIEIIFWILVEIHC